MGVFFGTDGLRGKFNDDLSFSIIYNCGNALGSEIFGAKILVGRDTRCSGSLVSLAFACGAMNAGSNICDIGVCPTAGIAYLTKKHHFDFGVVISASHNPAEFNGIKIFDKFGKKIGDKIEERLEKKFMKQTTVSFDEVGHYDFYPKLVQDYEKFLSDLFDFSLNGKKIVLDCSNGASYKIAKKVFKEKGAKLYMIGANPSGININRGCGALHTEKLQEMVKKQGADFGFAFDGDSDRLIAVDECGKIITGDELVYVFAMHYKSHGKLLSPAVVGTRHTNMGVEKALKSQGIELIRTDIGDKYVNSMLVEKDLLIGGEQSGHVIVRDLLSTGDGILNALLLSSIITEKNVKLSQLTNIRLSVQTNINIEVKDKLRVINSEKLSLLTAECEKKLSDGRVMIRVSGTEPYIRIMVESLNQEVSKKVANEIAECVRQIDKEENQCAE